MMNSVLQILIETFVVSIAYLAAYYIFMRNERFFMLNRLFLLFSMIFALAYPFVRISIAVAGRIELPAVVQDGMMLPVFEVRAGSGAGISTVQWLGFAYFAGVAVMLVLYLTKVVRVISLIARSKKIKKDGFRLIFSDKTETPFSFFNYIVIPENQYGKSEMDAILMHEKNHIRQLHSIDLMLGELFKAVQWFNPAGWMYNRELRNVHEFLADSSVINSGINREKYISLLIFNTNECQSYGICNNFNILLTKKRIKMIMDTQKSKKSAWLKVMPAIALTICLLAAHTSCTEQKTSDKQGKTEETPTGTGKIPDSVTYIVDGKVVNDISDISVDNIESISVCKEREQVLEISKKYGITAGNGIVEIVTKPASRSGKNSISEVSVVGYGNPKAEDTDPSVYTNVDVQPEFPGGYEALMKYLRDNISYPAIAAEQGITGKVMIRFIISSDGTIRDIKIVKGADPSLNKEAIRALESMPKWIPGKQNGKPVDMYYTLPVNFSLN